MGLSKRFTSSIPATGSVANALANVIGQRVGPERTGLFQLKLTVPAAGAGVCEAEIFASGRTLKERSVIPIESAAGVGPNQDTPYIVREPVVGGEELIVRLYNSSAGAIVATVDAEEIATG